MTNSQSDLLNLHSRNFSLELLAYISALFVGISLGLIGAGGSILTVPVFVYLLNIDPVIASTCSLFTVGCTSFVGSVRSYLTGQVQWRTVYLFGLPSFVAALLTHKWLLPTIPDTIFQSGSFVLHKGTMMLILFALLMLVAGFRMIRKEEKVAGDGHAHYTLVIFAGLITGFVTGLLGAGGGFIIIPALVLGLNIPVKKAIGTSLLIITINTLLTFAGSYQGVAIPWNTLLIFTAISVAGIFIGQGLALKIHAEKLKPAFGWFVIGMGVVIVVNELFF